MQNYEECLRNNLYKSLSERSVLVQPISLFESPGTLEDVVRRLMCRWEALATRSGFDRELIFESLSWLMTSIWSDQEALVFFGSAIYAAEGESIGDIDVARITNITNSRFSARIPPSVSVLERDFFQGDVLEGLEPACVNSLLLFSYGSGSTRLSVRIGQIREDQSRIFKELVFISLEKILAKEGVDLRRFGIWLGNSSLASVRQCAREMDPQRLNEMTHQALRRIRVKESEIKRLTGQFIRDVKKVKFQS